MKLIGMNQLGVPDITYTHLKVEFDYLAVILDSRKVVGWTPDRRLSDAPRCRSAGASRRAPNTT